MVFGSSNNNIATVDNSCTIPIGANSCIVAVQASMVTGESTVSISATAVAHILSNTALVTVKQEQTLALIPDLFYVIVGDDATITAKVESIVLSPVTVNFASSNESVVKLLNSSCVISAQESACSVMVSGVSSGATASISAIAPNYVLTSPATVRVTAKPLLTLSPNPLVVLSFGIRSLTAVVESPATSDLTVTFSTSNRRIANVVPETCIITTGNTFCSVNLVGLFFGYTSISAVIPGYTLRAADVIYVF